MFHRNLTTIGGIALSAMLFTGCSGAGSSIASIPAVSPVTKTPVVTPSKKGQVSVRLLIPNKTAAALHNASLKRGVSSLKPQYVSTSTLSVAVTSSQNGTTIDNTAISTDPSKNPNCATVATGVSCTFTLGALSPTTDFKVSTYDKNPSILTGGSTSVEPTTANLLSTGSALGVVITPGQTNPVAIALGGVVSTISLASTQNTAVAAGNVVSLPGTLGTEAAETLTFEYTAFDASHNIIVAGVADPLANPVTVSIAETNPGSSPFTTVSVAGETLGYSATSSNTSDVFTLSFNGGVSGLTNATAYSAVITASASAATDQISGSPAAGSATAAFTLAPLYLTGSSLDTNDTFVTTGAANGFPTLNYAQQGANAPLTEISLVQAMPPTGHFYPSNANIIAGNACTNFAFPEASSPRSTDVAEVLNATYTGTPTNGLPCVFNISDGQSTDWFNASYLPTGGNGSVVIPVIPGISANPASGVTAYCDPANDDQYCAQFPLNFHDSFTSTPTYSILSSSGTNISSCQVYTDYNESTCVNSTGIVFLYMTSYNVYAIAMSKGNFGGPTGNMTMTVQINDGAGNTIPYVINAVFGAGTNPSAFKRQAASIKHALPTIMAAPKS